MKLFVTATCWIMMFANCMNTANRQVKLVFNENFNQSSSLVTYKNYLTIVDTSFNQDGYIAGVSKYNFRYSKDTFIKFVDSNSVLLNNKLGVPTIQNLAQYYCNSDPVPGFFKEENHLRKNIYELKDAGKFIVYLFRDSVGVPFLGIYNKKENEYFEQKISNYTDYYPEMFLYDFSGDNVPEVLLFTKSYIQNHYLIEVRVYLL